MVVAGELEGQPIHHRPMPLDERMERSAVAGRRAGYEIRIRRRTETAVHCHEYDETGAETVDRCVCRGFGADSRRAYRTRTVYCLDAFAPFKLV